jgi:hypothetical protein
MKTALLIAFALFFTSLAPKKGLLITTDEVICTIDRTTTIEQLQAFKTRLWNEKKITLDINEFEVNDENNHIEKVGIAVDCHDGFKGSITTTLHTRWAKVGFYRSYASQANTPFAIGKMPFRK